MKRGGSLTRTTPMPRPQRPLRGGAPLLRGEGLHPTGQLPQRRTRPRRRDRGGEQDWLIVVRPMLWLRCRGVCEWCGLPLDPGTWQAHHRQLRTRGGPDHITNAAALHPLCHLASGPDGVHREEQHHRIRGFMLSSSDIPETALLVLPGDRPVELTAAGRYVDLP